MLTEHLQYGSLREDRHRPTLQMDIDSYINLLSFETNFASLFSHDYRYFN